MAAEVDTSKGPPLGSPKELVRHHGLGFATDKNFRRVVYVNVAFLGAILVMNYLLDLPRALEPFAAVLLYFPLAIGQWRFWKWGHLDARTALVFVRLHRRAFRDSDPLEALEKPDVVRGEHFRVITTTPMTMGRTAGRAFYVYTIALTLGVIFSTLFLPITMGAQVSRAEYALRSSSVAFLTLMGAFTIAWILPPMWLIEDAGVRHYSRRMQSVESVARWYQVQLGPIIGVGAIGTFFLIYWVAGFTLIEAIFGLLQLSLSLYPASLTATFLYQKFREKAAVEQLKATLEKEHVLEHPTLLTALVRIAPK